MLSLFNEDAVVTIQSARSVHEGRDAEFRKMYVELFEKYRKYLRHIYFRQ
ncbi:hypothetical protein ACWDT6_25795 [Nocardia grenadensis]